MTIVVPNLLCEFLGIKPRTVMTKQKLLTAVGDKLSNVTRTNDISGDLSDEDTPKVQITPRKPMKKMEKVVPLDRKKWGLSGNLCEFFGIYPDSTMTHQEALSRTVKYIKSNNHLLRQDDFTKFITDERLNLILDPKLECSFINLKHHLQKHYIDLEAVDKKQTNEYSDDEEPTVTFLDNYGREITFLKPVVEKVRISDALADLLEVPEKTIMGRDEASNRVTSYIKFRELDERPQGFFIKPDLKLKNVLDPMLPGVDHYSFINLQAHLVKHFTVVTEEEIAQEKKEKKAFEKAKKEAAKMQDLED